MSVKRINHWIGGRMVEGTSGRTGPVYNPAQGVQVAEVALASAAEVDAVVEAARNAFPAWRATGLSRRAEILFRMRELLDANRKEVAAVITAEHGKVISDAEGEVARGLENLEFACGVPYLLRGAYSEQASTGVDVHSVAQPLGVVAGITPFNFPAMVPLWMMSNGIACGNCFILKPSEKDPSASLVLADLWKQAGLPDGVFNVIHGDRVAVDRILEHPDIAAVSFVGSTPIAPPHLRDREPQRQAGAGPRRGQEPHGRAARRRCRRGRGRRGVGRLRLGGRAVHGGLGHRGRRGGG